MGRLGAVLRRIKTNVPALKTLGAPEWLLTRWGAREHGLILITGPTGSGKSTTIASLLQWMNENLVRNSDDRGSRRVSVHQQALSFHSTTGGT